MDKVKRSFTLIFIGLINFLHGSLHVIQFLQSILLISNNHSHNHSHDHSHETSFIDSLLHSPLFSLFWGLVGIITLWIGIKDYRHHKNCDHLK